MIIKGEIMVRFMQVLGGLALFLYGIRTLSGGMEKISSLRIQQWLDRMVNRPVKAAVFGAAATAIIQSSGMLMVTMIGLINANLMTLEQAISVMMGQEIGTTITAQIVSFRIGSLAYIFITAGMVIKEFVSNRKWQDFGQVILGFGIVSLGMNLMSGALSQLAELPVVTQWLTVMGREKLAGVFAGMVVTALVQSSSAVTGLVVAMGISQTITLPGAVALILGANIGSCVTGLIASLSLSRNSRRASIAQILINVIGVVLFFPFVTPYAQLVAHTSADLPRQIANAHTIFNLSVSVLLFPFIKPLAWLTDRLIPKSVHEEKPPITHYIDPRQYELPAVALNEATKELWRIADATAEMVGLCQQALVVGDLAAANQILALEKDFMDPICVVLEDFINTLMQGDLSVDQQHRCFQIKHWIIDLERVGDLTENIAQSGQQRLAAQVSFSEDGAAELTALFNHARQMYDTALQAIRTGDEVVARQACQQEEEFDHKYMEARAHHLQRLVTGVCQPEADIIFSDVIRDLERICDHADNLVLAVLTQ